MGWILSGEGLHHDRRCSRVTCRTCPAIRVHVWLSKWHWTSNVIVGLALLAFGGWPYVLWGIFFRTTFGLHATWLVNSATHIWGSRRFETRDDSTNNWWVALLTFGEGWHNNHHAHPTSARHGLAWYESTSTGSGSARSSPSAWPGTSSKRVPSRRTHAMTPTHPSRSRPRCQAAGARLPPFRHPLFLCRSRVPSQPAWCLPSSCSPKSPPAVRERAGRR